MAEDSLSAVVQVASEPPENWWARLNALAEMPLVAGVAALLGLYAAYWLGLMAYARQKDAEHVRSRLIDGGVDALSADLEYMLSVHRHNWQMLLRHLKLFRDAPQAFNLDAFFASLQELDASRFAMVPAKRVSDLLDDKVIWHGAQKVYSFVGTKNDFVYGDFGSALIAAINDPAHFDKGTFIKKATDEALKMSKAVNDLYAFLSRLAHIANLADRHITDRKSAEAFRHREDVKKAVAEIKAGFDDFKENRPSSETA